MTTFADMSLLLMAFFALMYSFINVDVHEQAKFAASVRGGFGVELLEVSNAETLTLKSGEQYTKAKRTGSPDVLGFGAKEKKVDASGLQGGLSSEYSTLGEGDLMKLEEVLSDEMEAGRVKIKVDADDLVVELQSFATSGGKNISVIASAGRQLIHPSTLIIAAKVADLEKTLAKNIQVSKQDLAADDPDFEDRKRDAQDKYNKLIKEFDDEILANKFVVKLKEDELIVRLASVEAFISGSARLNPQSRRILDKLGGSLRADAGKIRIEGHTDNIPIIFSERFISNWDLSAARSSSVAAALIEDSGLKASRLMVAGFADTQPLASNDTEQGRKRNRRIDIIVRGVAGVGAD
jgi:chemotaxis protein MotB